MTGVISTIPKHQFFDNAGLLAAGYKLYTYLAGSLTPATTWQDQGLLSANTNPVVLDARGECSIWLDNSKEYKFILKTSSDVSVWTVDDISGPVSSLDTGSTGWLTSISGTNVILATSPTIAAYSAGQTVRFVSSGANTSTVTININSLGAKAITKNGTTALVSGDIPAGAVVELVYDGVQFQMVALPKALSSGAFATVGTAAGNLLALDGSAKIPTVDGSQITGIGTQVQPISASVAANALTISASALSLDFRSATLGSGTVTNVRGAPANLVISSGSSLGTVSAKLSRIAILAMNNAGTIELAAVNIAGGNDLSETGLISTTAEGGAGAADSSNVIYSTTARTNVAYRVIGYVESTQATAGTWATAPSTIQGAGGQALNAMSSIGFGQTWQDLTGSRALSTTYYNTSPKPIQVIIGYTGAISTPSILINGLSIFANTLANAGYQCQVSFLVPVGSTYRINPASSETISKWLELR